MSGAPLFTPGTRREEGPIRRIRFCAAEQCWISSGKDSGACQSSVPPSPAPAVSLLPYRYRSGAVTAAVQYQTINRTRQHGSRTAVTAKAIGPGPVRVREGTSSAPAAALQFHGCLSFFVKGREVFPAASARRQLSVGDQCGFSGLSTLESFRTAVRAAGGAG